MWHRTLEILRESLGHREGRAREEFLRDSTLHKGADRNPMIKLKYYDGHSALPPDLLHQEILNLCKNLVNKIKEGVGKGKKLKLIQERVDLLIGSIQHRYSCSLPALPLLHVGKWSGKEFRLWSAIGSIACHSLIEEHEYDCLVAHAELLYALYAPEWLPIYSENISRLVRNHRTLLYEIDPRNLFMFHNGYHWEHYTKIFGSPLNFDTESGERTIRDVRSYARKTSRWVRRFVTSRYTMRTVLHFNMLQNKKNLIPDLDIAWSKNSSNCWVCGTHISVGMIAVIMYQEGLHRGLIMTMKKETNMLKLKWLENPVHNFNNFVMKFSNDTESWISIRKVHRTMIMVGFFLPKTTNWERSSYKVLSITRNLRQQKNMYK